MKKYQHPVYKNEHTPIEIQFLLKEEKNIFNLLFIGKNIHI